MATKLDDISLMLGRMESDIKNIGAAVTENRSVADRRHEENKRHLNNIDTALATLEPAVAWMKPIVEGYQVTRWKIVGAVGLAVVVVTLFGWIVSAFAAKLLALAWAAVTRP